MSLEREPLNELRVKLQRLNESEPDAGESDGDRLYRELLEFDWYKQGQYKMPDKSYLRKLDMLVEVRKACEKCICCELGRQKFSRDSVEYDPHVFSTMNPVRFLVVGQNPGFNEVKDGLPFVGDAGKNFNKEIEKYGLHRDDFYITNSVKCFRINNEPPTTKHKKRCKPFLEIEINLIRPLLVVALGASAFEQLCPNVKFSDALGKITDSDEYDVPVFAIYHPSPKNLDDPDRLKAYTEQTKLMCGLVKALKKQHNC